MRQKSFPTRWVPLLLLTRSYPQRREVHAKKYLNNHKIKKKMKRKLRRDGSEIHTRQILLVLFREYAAKIQVFRYLKCFSPLNLTTSSSPQRFFTRDVKSLFICIGARNPKVWGSIPHGDSEFSLCPTLWQDKKKHLSLFLYRAQNLSSLLFLPINITLSTLLILAVCRTRVIWTA